MNKTLISIILSVALISCNGPGKGPLVQESFEDSEPTFPMTMGMQAHGRPVVTKIDVKVAPCADCITIGNVITNKKDFTGKTINIKGVVTKVNDGIMDRNWVHIQDGTEANGIFDFTITTIQDVKEGDELTFNGTIALDRDFGFGYSYDIIMENAQVVR